MDKMYLRILMAVISALGMSCNGSESEDTKRTKLRQLVNPFAFGETNLRPLRKEKLRDQQGVSIRAISGDPKIISRRSRKLRKSLLMATCTSADCADQI